MMNPKGILFLSQHNAARTQMAEGLARKMFEPKIKSMSAGTHPRDVDPLVVEVMAEIGIDVRKQSAKPVSLISPAAVDVIVIFGTQDFSLPAFTRQQCLKWPLAELPDSQEAEEERRQLFRQRRDELVERLTLLARILE
jgi:arsenate reductase